MSHSLVNVTDIIPFWRYAVGPTEQHSPAIPFYTFKAASALFEEAKRELPWSGVTLYKRTWNNRINAVIEYSPNRRTNGSGITGSAHGDKL